MLFAASPTGGIGNYANSLYRQSAQDRSRGIDMVAQRHALELRKRQEFQNVLRRMAAKKEQKKAESEGESAWGGLGAVGGAVVGGLLAIPTGGLSLAAGASLGAGLGGGAESVVSGDGGRGAQQIVGGLAGAEQSLQANQEQAWQQILRNQAQQTYQNQQQTFQNQQQTFQNQQQTFEDEQEARMTPYRGYIQEMPQLGGGR